MEQTFVPFAQMQSLPEPEWLIEGFLPKGYLAILASAPKMGKTCFATALALAVSTGERFAGMKTEQAAVLWCCLEESSSERALVLRQYKPTNGKVPELLTTTELPFHTVPTYRAKETKQVKKHQQPHCRRRRAMTVARKGGRPVLAVES